MKPTQAVSTATDPVPPELVERFRAALERLDPAEGVIGLAVSGGADSMAMMLLAHAAIPGGFEVASVNHGLRPESKDECALVVAACKERDIPCAVLNVKIGKGNVQEQARIARYETIGDWASRNGLVAVATAHHADDQAETFLMRLARGSGVAGLGGVRAATHAPPNSLYLIRPLLGFRHAELVDICKAAGAEFVRDPSNQDERYDRVRFRKALAQCDLVSPDAIVASAAACSDADEALDWAKQKVQSERVSWGGGGVQYRYTYGIPRAIELRIVREAILVVRYGLKLGGNDPRGAAVAQLHQRLIRGEGGNLAGVLVTIDDGDWVFRPEPPRKTG